MDMATAAVATSMKKTASMEAKVISASCGTI